MFSVHKSEVDGRVLVIYSARAAQQEITRGEYDLIKSLPEQKIRCIEFIRAQYSLGLYEAKQVVDSIHASVNLKY